MRNPTDRYFAARPIDKIGQSLANRLEEEQGEESTQRQEVYATAYEHYYGLDFGRGPSFAIQAGGDVGELSEIRINKAAAVAKSFLSLVIGPKVNWRPQAASNSGNARAATILSLNLLEWYWKKFGLERVYARMAEIGIAWGEAFVLPLWDTTRGPIVTLDENEKPVRGGDLRYHNLLPWDVVRDSAAHSYDDAQWKFCRLWANKWDLVTLYPKDVLGQPTREKLLSVSNDRQMCIATPLAKQATDVVPVWYFFHEPCPSLPAGREVVFVSGSCVLRDKTLSYGPPDERTAPLVRFAFDELYGTPYGYSRWWDTLGIQELMDGLETAIATNQLALSTQSVAIEQGTNVNPDFLKGMKTFEVPKGGRMPEAIQLTQSPPEVFNHLKQKTIEQQQLLNLNDTFRGQPDTAQMNAQAFTVLATQAIQQNGPVQRAALDAVAMLGTKTIQIVAERVKDDRKLRITGKQSKYLYDEKEFRGGDIQSITEVFVDIGNPIEQTAAGRFTIAQMYQAAQQANGQPVTVEQLQQVIDTGRLEPVTQSARDEMMLIESENERLGSGETVLAHALDNHMLHGKENLQPILNPEGRRNAKTNDATNEHLHQHYCLHFGIAMVPGQSSYQAAMADPAYPANIRILLGQQAPPPPAMPGGPGGAPPDVAATMTPQGPQDLPPLPPGPPPPQAAEPLMPSNGALPAPPMQ